MDFLGWAVVVTHKRKRVKDEEWIPFTKDGKYYRAGIFLAKQDAKSWIKDRKYVRGQARIIRVNITETK